MLASLDNTCPVLDHWEKGSSVTAKVSMLKLALGLRLSTWNHTDWLCFHLVALMCKLPSQQDLFFSSVVQVVIAFFDCKTEMSTCLDFKHTQISNIKASAAQHRNDNKKMSLKKKEKDSNLLYEGEKKTELKAIWPRISVVVSNPLGGDVPPNRPPEAVGRLDTVPP